MWHGRVADLVEALREIEDRLIEFAKSRFDHPSSSSSSDSVDIIKFDTKIPRSVVPLKHHECSVHKEDADDDCYRIHGLRITNPSGSSSSPPLVMLHGYMNGASYFYRNFLGLSRHFKTVYSLDMLGWGLSSRPSFTLNDDTMETAEDFFVESLEAWRQSNGVPRMILAGHSMGGYISVAYCERYPEHVERLILISPAGVTPETEDALEKRRKNERLPLGLRFLGGLYRSLFFPYMTLGNIIRTAPAWSEARFLEYVEKRLPAITDHEERKVMSKYLFLNSALPGSGEHCLSRFLTPNTFGRNPTEFRIPNLRISHVSFLYGERDWMDVHGGLRTQTTCEEKSAVQCPSVSVYQVSDAGHLLMVDNWQEFNSAVVLSAGLQPEGNKGPLPLKLHPNRTSQGMANELNTKGFRPEQAKPMAA